MLVRAQAACSKKRLPLHPCSWTAPTLPPRLLGTANLSMPLGRCAFICDIWDFSDFRATQHMFCRAHESVHSNIWHVAIKAHHNYVFSGSLHGKDGSFGVEPLYSLIHLLVHTPTTSKISCYPFLEILQELKLLMRRSKVRGQINETRLENFAFCGPIPRFEPG